MAYSTFLAPFSKLAKAVSERGWKGAITQLYLIGDLKFGELKGTDRFGNKYYENLELPYGQHRWIEYKEIHNYDASMIAPEWHGWMHHTFDETPSERAEMLGMHMPSAYLTDAAYNTHLGWYAENAQKFAQVDTSQYRQRGYKVGSLMTGPDDKDEYYKQPGHPLSSDAEKGGRFQKIKGTKSVFDPTVEK